MMHIEKGESYDCFYRKEDTTRIYEVSFSK
jgi:hypothetical protein